MALPPDTYLTLSELRNFFQRLTITLLGMDEMLEAWEEYQANPQGAAPPNPYYFVRASWPTGGAPAWKIDENVTFLRVMEADSQYNRQREVKFEPYDEDEHTANQITGYTRVMGISWVCYGPLGFDNTQTIRDRIFYQTNHDTLARQKIYLVPDIPAPRRSPELFEGRWWERADVSISFNELVVRNWEVPYLRSAEITITGDQPPVTADADVTEDTPTH